MSLRQGLQLVSGAGAVPYINEVTKNWEILGQDTGLQAMPIPITIAEYSALKEAGALDDTRIYHITDNVPVMYRNRVISKDNDWVYNEGYYTSTISIEGVTSNDTVMIELSNQITDAEYMEQFAALEKATILRIRADANSVILLSKSRPELDIHLDICVTKTVVSE